MNLNKYRNSFYSIILITSLFYSGLVFSINGYIPEHTESPDCSSQGLVIGPAGMSCYRDCDRSGDWSLGDVESLPGYSCPNNRLTTSISNPSPSSSNGGNCTCPSDWTLNSTNNQCEKVTNGQPGCEGNWLGSETWTNEGGVCVNEVIESRNNPSSSGIVCSENTDFYITPYMKAWRCKKNLEPGTAIQRRAPTCSTPTPPDQNPPTTRPTNPADSCVDGEVYFDSSSCTHGASICNALRSLVGATVFNGACLQDCNGNGRPEPLIDAPRGETCACKSGEYYLWNLSDDSSTLESAECYKDCDDDDEKSFHDLVTTNFANGKLTRKSNLGQCADPLPSCDGSSVQDKCGLCYTDCDDSRSHSDRDVLVGIECSESDLEALMNIDMSNYDICEDGASQIYRETADKMLRTSEVLAGARSYLLNDYNCGSDDNRSCCDANVLQDMKDSAKLFEITGGKISTDANSYFDSTGTVIDGQCSNNPNPRTIGSPNNPNNPTSTGGITGATGTGFISGIGAGARGITGGSRGIGDGTGGVGGSNGIGSDGGAGSGSSAGSGGIGSSGTGNRGIGSGFGSGEGFEKDAGEGSEVAGEDARGNHWSGGRGVYGGGGYTGSGGNSGHSGGRVLRRPTSSSGHRGRNNSRGSVLQNLKPVQFGNDKVGAPQGNIFDQVSKGYEQF